MSIQLSFFEIEQTAPKQTQANFEKKRIRLEQPLWDKFYSVFAFNEVKYHKLLGNFIKKNGLKGILDINKKDLDELKEQCYVLDKKGQKRHLGDEKHIFRYGTLQNIHTEIAKYVNIPFSFEDTIYEQEGLLVHITHYDKEICLQAEIKDTWTLPLLKRVKIHIELLRLLKKSVGLKEAMEQVKCYL